MINDEAKLIIDNNEFEILIEESQILKRIKEMADEISRDYKDKKPIILGALNGSFIFVSDLVRNMNIECEIDFLKVSSYGKATKSSGHIELLSMFTSRIEGRHIIIADDIIDSGLTLSYFKKLIYEYEPLSVKIAALLFKEVEKKSDLKPEYIGFNIPNRYVIGYGLDYSYFYRNLKSIYAMKNTGT